MPQVIFKRAGELITSKYLLGQYSWTKDMRIVEIHSAFEPGEGDTELQLEVNGTLLAAYPLVIAPGMDGQEVFLGSGITIPANQRVRWKIISDSSSTQAASDISVVMRVEVDAFASDLLRENAYKLRYVNGTEAVDLYSYNPSTRTYSEITSGLASGRCLVDPDGQSISIGENIVFFVSDSGITYTSVSIVENPQVAMGDDVKIEFYIGSDMIGELHETTGFKVRSITEAAPVPGDNFCFSKNGTVISTLDRIGLTCNNIVEL